jgi:Bacteriophage T4-like portal protein (Gp20)
MANFFGFEIRRKGQDQEQLQDKQPSFIPAPNDDGAVVVAAGGAYGTYVDLQGSARTEAELVTKYREMALHPEVENAIDDIVNEAIVQDANRPIVQLNLDDVELSPTIKKMVVAEFSNIIKMLQFNQMGYDLFRRWYIDGRLYYHVIIDVTSPRDGIKELRYVDPRKIRKIRETKRKRDKNTQTTQVSVGQEYYLFNERGFQSKVTDPNSQTATAGVKIATDSIVYVTSGLINPDSTAILSYLHKAIKPLNQLRALEDSAVIYRMTRAPERRIFYIDVGNLPKMKAEQYLRDMMTRHKNRVVYDAATGETRDDRKFMTMLEDYWFPRREGTRGTEVQTLPAGQQLGEMGDIEYFQDQLLRALNVPASRLIKDATFSFGQDQSINRDEVKFAKFVDRMRLRFNQLFLQTLETQLRLKGVMTAEDWEQIVEQIRFDYAKDSFYEEQKNLTVLQQRIAVVQQMQPFTGSYYSHDYIRKSVLYQTDETIEEQNKLITQERDDPVYEPLNMLLMPEDPAQQGNPAPAKKK